MSDETITKTGKADALNMIGDVIADALGASTATLSAHVVDDKALLAKYEMSKIDNTFTMRDPETNELFREQEPCYQLRADGFYGNGLHGSWFQEGAVIVYPDPPNEHMEPMNRAAAVNYCRWLESLPINRVAIDIGDMQQAAQMLAKDPRVASMSPPDAQMATIRVAEGLKMKREGKSAMDLRVGQINRNFAPQSGGKSPPMLGAKMSDMSQIGPGMTRNVAAVTGAAPTVRRAAPFGGPPPGR